MKKYFIITITFLIYSGTKIRAQESTGVNFEQKLGWTQIKDRARAEGKYIFVDVFATWCGPCKEMDREVYAQRELGNYINDKFISVKVQADSSKNDNAEVKAWYADAKKMLIDYRITGYPSFLFFSPDGILVHRGLGFKSQKEFKNLAIDALNPRKQYVALLEDYQHGKRDYKVMPELVHMAEELKLRSLADEISNVYYNDYLSTLPDDSLFTKNNLSFVGSHLRLLNYRERLLQLILKRPEEANRLMDSKDYSQQVVAILVKRDEIYHKLWKPDREFISYTPNPDWKKIYSAITAKYGECYADRLIPPAQLLFYQQEGNWKEYVKYVERIVKKNPPRRDGNKFLSAIGKPMGGDYDNWGLNDLSWNLFLNCNNPILLKVALDWSNLSIKLAWCDLSFKQLSNPRSSNLHQYLDTKANLLYKLGRVKDAIKCQEEAIGILLKGTEKDSDAQNFYAKTYKENIEKIKRGEPTWPIKKST